MRNEGTAKETDMPDVAAPNPRAAALAYAEARTDRTVTLTGAERELLGKLLRLGVLNMSALAGTETYDFACAVEHLHGKLGLPMPLDGGDCAAVAADARAAVQRVLFGDR